MWLGTHSVDLREADFNNITSSAKTWLFADMLLKPEESVLHRPASAGGMSHLNVKMKALVGLIRSFLETADRTYITNYCSDTMFKYHIQIPCSDTIFIYHFKTSNSSQ